MKLALITLNFNSAESTIKLLDSLQNQTDPDFSLIVVDNNSSDVQIIRDYIEETKSSIRLIENKANLGFAGGNNPVLKYVFEKDFGWAVLINNDTLVKPDFIAQLKKNLGFKRGIVGIPLDEGLPVGQAGGHIAYGGRIDWFNPTPEHIYEWPGPGGSELYYPIGAGIAISRETFRTIGGLDEEYFLYFEEADYALKARNFGVSVEFVREPVIHHAVSGTTRKLGSPLLLRYHYRNALYFNFKRGSMLTKILVWPWSTIIIVKQLIKLMFDIHPEESRAILAGVIDFYQNKMGRIDKDKIKVGIECENIEDSQSRWGIGNITINLLKEYVSNPNLRNHYELHLYFKKSVPADPVLQDPRFKIHILSTDYFNIFYHLLMPLRAMWDRLDWMFFPAYMLPPLYIGKSIVILTGDVYYEYKKGSLPFRYHLAYWLFTNWAAESATKILAISESSKKEVSRLYGIPPERIFVSHLGIKDFKIKNSELIQKLKIKNQKYILYVGQMFPRRHALESILAFKKIAPEFPDLKFILVGKDKYQPLIMDRKIEEINNKLGSERIIHYNYVADSELHDLYSGAKLFVYVSSDEAFGLPPVEAAGYSVPVIVKNSEINHELFDTAAFFVNDPKDIDLLASVFKKGLTDESARRAMIDHYKKIIPKFSWRKFTERFFNQLNA